jgi:hypothetical protein
VVAEFTATIETETLGLNCIPEANQERHQIIQSLDWHRHTAKEIAAYLTKLGYKTPRGGNYYPQLVGATLSKLRRRKARTKKTTISVSEVTFWLKSSNILLATSNRDY